MSQSPRADVEQTEVGSYFVANYPPFSVWNAAAVVDRGQAGARITARRQACRSACICTFPFCRKRCHFCYFRVYTDRNAQ